VSLNHRQAEERARTGGGSDNVRRLDFFENPVKDQTDREGGTSEGGLTKKGKKPPSFAKLRDEPGLPGGKGKASLVGHFTKVD